MIVKSGGGIIHILQSILQEEGYGYIEPIHDYTKHTLKAFINFINSDFRSKKEEERSRHRVEDMGVMLDKLNKLDFNLDVIEFVTDVIAYIIDVYSKKRPNAINGNPEDFY